MGIPSIQAGGVLCELSGWTISNLKLQKLLYVAHMFHLGEEGGELINENFEAWMYGPVEPKLYRHCRGFGASKILNIFPWDIEFSKNSSYYRILKDTYEALKDTSGGRLVSFTHWEEGAWYEIYYGSDKNILTDNIITKSLFKKIIPNKLIREEYKKRVREDYEN